MVLKKETLIGNILDHQASTAESKPATNEGLIPMISRKERIVPC
jgi:hypothetical protein